MALPVESLALQLSITAALIALNACFVLAEISIVRVRSSSIELLARKGARGAARVQNMLENLDVYLSAVQMGITMTSLGLGWVGEPAVARLLEGFLQDLPMPAGKVFTHGLSLALAFGVITFLHIVLGELMPRSIAIQYAELISLWTSFPLRVFYLIFKIPTNFMANVSMWLLSLMRIKPASEAETRLSEEEMRFLLGSAEDKGGVSLERLMLLENVFDFGEAKVSEAMTPQFKIAYLSLAKSWSENLAVIRERRYSRYPLCEKDLESPIGLLHIKDLALSAMDGRGKEPDLKKLRRDIVEVSPGESLHKLLKIFPDRGIQMALVRNPSGGVAGLLTLEDILEEIVGEIHDEFDLPHAWSLMDVVVPSAVDVSLDAHDREGAIRRLTEKLGAAEPSLDVEEAVRLAWERETKFSSAVGHGVAVPHARIFRLPRPLVAIGRSTKALPFPAPDKAPVRLVFLILTPASAPVSQLKILARVASLMSNENVRRRLLRAKTEEHLLDMLRTADTVLASP